MVTLIPGTPQLRVGDASLVFFDEDEWCQVAGWFQGEYKLIDHPDAPGERLIVNNQGRGVVGLSEAGFIFSEPILDVPHSEREVGTSAQLLQPAGAAVPWDLIRGELQAFGWYSAVPAQRRPATSQTKIAGRPLPKHGSRPNGASNDRRSGGSDRPGSESDQ